MEDVAKQSCMEGPLTGWESWSLDPMSYKFNSQREHT